MSSIKRKHKRINIFKLILIIILFPIVIIWLILRLFKKKTNENIDIYNLSQVDSLSGEEFEELLKTIFEKQGYRAELTKKSHDYGADLLLKKNGKLTIVQAKCYDKNVGIKAIQEVISARKHYRANEMFVACNRYFSKDAIVLATEHDVRLIDRDVLLKLVRQLLPQIELKEKTYSATIPEEKAKIVSKYRFWI